MIVAPLRPRKTALLSPVVTSVRPLDQTLMAARADLVVAYAECRAAGNAQGCELLAESLAELDHMRASRPCRFNDRMWHRPGRRPV